MFPQRIGGDESFTERANGGLETAALSSASIEAGTLVASDWAIATGAFCEDRFREYHRLIDAKMQQRAKQGQDLSLLLSP